MNKYCLIGARGGSKSVKNKNIQTVNGRPLLTICIEKALKCNIYNKIIISSDSAIYENFVPRNSKVEFILRPSDIARDTSTEIEYITHIIKTKNLEKEDLISRMQCTSPFQSVVSMKKAVTMLEKSLMKFDSVQLISQASPSIYKAMRKCEISGLLSPAINGGSIDPLNRQSLEKSYFRSNFYVTTVAQVLKGKLLGERCYGLECEDREKIDVDTSIDLKTVQALAKVHSEWLDF